MTPDRPAPMRLVIEAFLRLGYGAACLHMNAVERGNRAAPGRTARPPAAPRPGLRSVPEQERS